MSNVRGGKGEARRESGSHKKTKINNTLYNKEKVRNSFPAANMQNARGAARRGEECWERKNDS